MGHATRPVGVRARVRIRARVRGRVQGVGFRPFVHHLAERLALGGFVRNDVDGVVLEVEGDRCAEFFAALEADAPPLMRIDAIRTETVPLRGSHAFVIETSGGAGDCAASIPPDAAVCDACLRELFDPADRHYRYPFLSCTHCGPRLSITRALPYDRPQTSMASFLLCADCAGEYHDLADRRYHAQPIACPACGPRLDMDPAEIMQRLGAGQILAIKGIGGFHLACDARNEAAVARLRQRKGRAGKPLAVMVANLPSARRLAEISNDEARLLHSPERPIVVCRGRGGLPPAVADGLDSLGLMLPYTPLHYLVFHQAAGCPDGIAWLGRPHDLVLVMTSANPSSEPLVIDDAEAAARLGHIADAVVGHDRTIVTRCDDSVVRVVAGAPRFLRRARGYTPDTLALAEDGPAVLGVGALLKVAPCLVRGQEALFAQHIGNVTNGATARFLAEAVEHLAHLLRTRPAAIACDLHPDYATSRFAAGAIGNPDGVPVIAVQHHHAHLAAVAAEYGITGPLTGLVLDGFGLGSDGTLWGGELLHMHGAQFERRGHLAPLALPGGDRAAREPWRMAAAALHALGRGDEIAMRLSQPQAAAVRLMLESGINAPLTTSCGRLFDAAAGLLGICAENRFEAEAAMLLEGLCQAPRVLKDGWRLHDGILDLTPLLAALIECRPQVGAELFHGTLAAALAELVRARMPAGESRLAVTGGCAANRVLTERLAGELAAEGIEVLLPRFAPPGDGGLSLGQALVARRKMMEVS